MCVDSAVRALGLVLVQISEKDIRVNNYCLFHINPFTAEPQTFSGMRNARKGLANGLSDMIISLGTIHCDANPSSCKKLQDFKFHVILITAQRYVAENTS